jgi:hypothetical protein
LTNLNFSLDWNVLKAISPLKIGRGALLLSLKMEITLRLRLALFIIFFFLYIVFLVKNCFLETTDFLVVDSQPKNLFLNTFFAACFALKI